MLVNLVPEFLAVLAAPDPAAAYHDYLERHKPVLQSYWHNYVLDPASPHAAQVIAASLKADRADLSRLLDDVDVTAIADDARHRLRVPRALHGPGQPADLRHGPRAASPAPVDRARSGARGALHVAHEPRGSAAAGRRPAGGVRLLGYGEPRHAAGAARERGRGGGGGAGRGAGIRAVGVFRLHAAAIPAG